MFITTSIETNSTESLTWPKQSLVLSQMFAQKSKSRFPQVPSKCVMLSWYCLFLYRACLHWVVSWAQEEVKERRMGEFCCTSEREGKRTERRVSTGSCIFSGHCPLLSLHGCTQSLNRSDSSASIVHAFCIWDPQQCCFQIQHCIFKIFQIFPVQWLIFITLTTDLRSNTKAGMLLSL